MGEDESSPPSRTPWHLDRKITVAMICAVIGLTMSTLIHAGSVIWWASSMNTRVEKLEIHVLDTKAQGEQIATLQANFSWIRDSLTEIKALLRIHDQRGSLDKSRPPG